MSEIFWRNCDGESAMLIMMLFWHPTDISVKHIWDCDNKSDETCLHLNCRMPKESEFKFDDVVIRGVSEG